MPPSAHVEKLRAARLTMLLSWCGGVSANVVGWAAVGWVLTSRGPRPHVGDVLPAATIATFLLNVAAVGLALVSLVMGRRRCSPWPAIASLVFGAVGFAGTFGLFFFWGFASIGIK